MTQYFYKPKVKTDLESIPFEKTFDEIVNEFNLIQDKLDKPKRNSSMSYRDSSVRINKGYSVYRHGKTSDSI